MIPRAPAPPAGDALAEPTYDLLVAVRDAAAALRDAGRDGDRPRSCSRTCGR